MPLKRTTSLSNLANIVKSILPGSPRRSPKSPKRPPRHPRNVTGKKPEGIAHRGGKKNKTQRKRL